MKRKSILSIFCWLLLYPGFSDGQLIVAHRGASADAPENTLAAFKLAWQQGADAIEGDFQLTADGQIVCLHDKDTQRTAGTPQIVAESTLEELQQLDVGRWKGSPFAGERIPTLAEVLQIIPPGKKIYLEVKCGPEILPELISQIDQSALTADQIVIISFNEQVIREARRQLPDLSAYWLTGFRAQKDGARETPLDHRDLVGKSKSAFMTDWKPSAAQVIETLRATSATALSCQAHEAVDRDFIQQIHQAGYDFHCWTVNDEKTARAMIELGVKSMTTDRPGWLRDLRH